MMSKNKKYNTIISARSADIIDYYIHVFAVKKIDEEKKYKKLGPGFFAIFFLQKKKHKRQKHRKILYVAFFNKIQKKTL